MPYSFAEESDMPAVISVVNNFKDIMRYFGQVVNFGEVMWLDSHPAKEMYPEPVCLWHDCIASQLLILVAFLMIGYSCDYTSRKSNGSMSGVKNHTFWPNPGPSSVNYDLQYKVG